MRPTDEPPRALMRPDMPPASDQTGEPCITPPCRYLAQAHSQCVLHPEDMCDSLADVPRWVFALLKGPLLSSNTPLSTHKLSDDRRIWLCTLYRSLPVEDLVTAIHPILSAYSKPGTCTDSDVPLHWAAMRSTGCRLFLLDAYTHIYVYLAGPHLAKPDPAAATAAGEAELEWPPSKSSTIWRDVLALKQTRLRMARVIVCQAGSEEGEGFEAYIEHVVEDSAEGTGKAERFSYGQFLRFMHREVSANLGDAPDDVALQPGAPLT